MVISSFAYIRTKNNYHAFCVNNNEILIIKWRGGERTRATKSNLNNWITGTGGVACLVVTCQIIINCFVFITKMWLFYYLWRAFCAMRSVTATHPLIKSINARVFPFVVVIQKLLIAKVESYEMCKKNDRNWLNFKDTSPISPIIIIKQFKFQKFRFPPNYSITTAIKNWWWPTFVFIYFCCFILSWVVSMMYDPSR